MNIIKKLLIYIFLFSFSADLSAFSLQLPFFKKKNTTPILKFITYDNDTKTRLTNFTVQTARISEKEKKGEAFIYKYTISASGYNAASDSIGIPYAFKGKAFFITNYLEPLIHKEIKTAHRLLVQGIILTNKTPCSCIVKILTNTNVIGNSLSDSNGHFIFTNLPYAGYVVSIPSPNPVYSDFLTNIIANTNLDKTNSYIRLSLHITLLPKAEKKKLSVHKKKKKYKKRKKPVKKKLTAYQKFFKYHYKVQPFTTVTLKKKTLLMKKQNSITVGRGATLIIDHSRIYSKSFWKGIRVQKGGTLIIRKSQLSKAQNLISAGSAKKIIIDSSSLFHNRTVLCAYNASVNVLHTSIQNNTNALCLKYSSGRIEGSHIFLNKNAFVSTNSKLEILSSEIYKNSRSLILTKSSGRISRTRIYDNHSDGLILNGGNVRVLYSDIFSNAENGILCLHSNPSVFSCNIYKNQFYAVKNGGVVDSCFIAYNNFSRKIDSTPDSGTKDKKYSTLSNMFIKQLYKVDAVRSLQLQQISFQGAGH